MSGTTLAALICVLVFFADDIEDFFRKVLRPFAAFAFRLKSQEALLPSDFAPQPAVLC